MAKFIKDFMKSIQSNTITTSLASDGEGAAEFTGCIDTGSYALNALLSGSIYGGIPNNKIVMFAGDPATGKTFFVLGICKNFLTQFPNGFVIYADSEAAVTKEMMEDRELDTKRVILSEPETIEKFHHHAVKVLDSYIANTGDKPPLLLVLDSLGALPSDLEVAHSKEGSNKSDLSKSRAIRGLFRVLTLRAAKAGVPVIFTNHVYETMDMYSGKIISGGMGPVFAASTVAMLSKSKEKEGKEVVGNIIKVKMYKSRISKENAEVDVKITYKGGLDKFYGLLDLAAKYDIIKKVSTQYVLADGRKVYGKEINENPEAVYTVDILDQLDKAAALEFKYGQQDVDDISKNNERAASGGPES